MPFFRNQPIKRKLTLLMVLVSGAALAMASTANMANNYATLRATKETQLITLAKILAENSTTALSFDLYGSLGPLLESAAMDETIEYAYVFDEEGTAVASYKHRPDDSFTPPTLSWTGVRYADNGHLEVTMPVVEEGEPVGTIYLHATLGDLYVNFQRNAAIITLVAFLALGMAAVLSARLQGIVSNPVVELAGTARRITEEGDYAIRVTPQSNDEIGNLYEQFNLMLARIQKGEADLRTERDHSAGIIEGSPGIVCGLTPDGTGIFMNPAGERLSGYSQEELAGKNWFELFAPNDLADGVTDLLDKLEKGDIRDHELVLLTKEQQRVTIAWNSLKRYDEHGELVELIGFGMDVTERNRAADELRRHREHLEELVLERTTELAAAIKELKRENAERQRAERKLKHYADELEQSNLELKQFAYVASHDLQEPLRAVGSFCELFARRYTGQFDEEADRWIGFIVDGAKRMQRLVQDLLDYSRIDSRAKPFVTTDTNKVFDLAVSNLHASIESSGAQVTRDDLPMVLGDASQLAQVFQNLIGNGIKFHGDRSPCVHVSATTNGEAYIFSFNDNGIGIEPEYREQIFDVFNRLHSVDEYAGTGIGLSICRKIALRHGGQIRIESEPGEGSVFFFSIPIQPDRRKNSEHS